MILIAYLHDYFFISDSSFDSGLGGMHSIPFRLLVLSNLDLQDVTRSNRLNWHPPGVIEELEHQPLWKSKLNTIYPQELGLILLSAQPATAKTLRVTADLARTPGQIVIFEALPPRIVNELNPLDAVSRYLSSEWKQCCEPLVWEVCSSVRLDTFRDTDSRIAHLDVSDCSFLKLIVHAPYSNQAQQIVLEDIELLGSSSESVAHVLDPSLSSTKQYEEFTNSGVIHRPVWLPLASDNDELQTVLLDAGVPMDLVAQVTTICEHKENMSNSQSERKVRSSDAGKMPPTSNSQISHIEFPTLESQNSIENNEPASPFDNVLRQYVEQMSRERHVLEEILTSKICTQRDEVSSWQSPTISPLDPVNSIEITLYTFGSFFTQCLLCGGAEIQVSCVQLVERVAPVVKKTIGTIPSFEGIIALIILSVREAKSSQAFHATIHLAYTVFLTETAKCKDDSSIDHENVCVLGLIEEIARANWSYGLRVILEWILASPLCWLVSHTAKTTLYKTSPRNVKPSERSSKVPPSIDRVFLQFIRLLIDQDLTRGNFFNELIDLTPAANAVGTIFARNRFRLLRLVLRNDIIRCQTSPNLKASIRTLCTSFLSLHSVPQSDQVTLSHDNLDAITTRLASECLIEIDRSTLSDHKHTHLLTSLHKQIDVSRNPNSHRSYRYTHGALFIQEPLLNAEEIEFTTQLQRYFSCQPRPNALYRHSFVHTSSSKSDGSAESSSESFQKGNISFQGHVVARTPPKGTFHDEIQRKSAPFVFDIDDNKLTTVGPDKITASFAVFRGSVERRSDSPKRSSRVSPEQKQTPTAGVTPSYKQQDVTYPDSTVINPLSGNPTRKNSARIEKISTPVPKSATSSQIPTTPTTDQMLSTAKHASYVPNHISATTTSAIEQTLKQPDDIKSLNSSNQPNRKSDKKAISKVTTKGKNKKDGKDSDNCVLQ